MAETRLSGSPLDRATLVISGFHLLEETGLDGLSMRSIGRYLEVHGSALYWHVRDRAELISLMAAEIYRGAFADVTESGTWQDWALGFGIAFRRRMLLHRDGARLCAAVTSEENATLVETARMIAPLCSLGLHDDDALVLYSSIASLSLGWVTYEQSHQMNSALSKIIDFEAAFLIGLSSLVRGFGYTNQ